MANLPEANPADVESIDAIIKAAYEVISGPAGQARDWDRERSLFWPGARLIPTSRGAGSAAAGRSSHRNCSMSMDISTGQRLFWSKPDFTSRRSLEGRS